jgi:tRNA modification GTPase
MRMARRSSSPSSADAEETIAAPATSPGGALRAVVRVSGPRAFELAAAFPRAVVRRGPRTYTREDTAEIHLPGAAPLVHRCLRLLTERGARLARPGEFTLRAFLHGRLDLAQAEAVERLISAGDEAERRAALVLLGGGWSRRLRDVEAALLDLCADAEAAIDFVDQDIEILSPAAARGRAAALLGRLRDSARSTSSSAVRDGLPTVVLRGRPNAGKSTLFNALAGADALVSPSAGTTRDVLGAEALIAPGLRVRLLDTAGVGQAADPLAAAAERRAGAAAAAADVALLVIDATSREAAPEPAGTTVIVANKIDLTSAEEVRARYAGRPFAAVSGLTGEGLDGLRRELARALAGDAGDGVRVSERQGSLLREADAALARAVERESPLEILALDLRAALAALGAITGRNVDEDLLDRVFSRFCLGK